MAFDGVAPPGARGATPDRNSVQSVEKALRLLRVLAGAGEPMSPAMLATQTKLSQTGVYRLLRALEKGRAVARRSNGDYVLGSLAYELVSGFDQSRLLKRAAVNPMLEARARCANETVSLSLPANLAEFVYIEVVRGAHEARDVVALYTPTQVCRGATSRLLLADMWRHYGAEFVRKYLTTALSDDALPAPVNLYLERIQRTAQLGYATTKSERMPGIAGLAVPVKGQFGQLLAVLTLSGPAEHFTRVTVPGWLGHLNAAADEITAHIEPSLG